MISESTGFFLLTKRHMGSGNETGGGGASVVKLAHVVVSVVWFLHVFHNMDDTKDGWPVNSSIVFVVRIILGFKLKKRFSVV